MTHKTSSNNLCAWLSRFNLLDPRRTYLYLEETRSCDCKICVADKYAHICARRVLSFKLSMLRVMTYDSLQRHATNSCHCLALRRIRRLLLKYYMASMTIHQSAWHISAKELVQTKIWVQPAFRLEWNRVLDTS